MKEDTEGPVSDHKIAVLQLCCQRRGSVVSVGLAVAF